MADKLSGAGLVKNPLFWLSIVAIVAVLLCLSYIFLSRTQKKQHTSNSTIDIKQVGGKDDKHKLDDKKFLKEVLDEVDKKIKKDREDNDKKIGDKMKKMEDEIKTFNQKSLEVLKEKVQPIIEEVIEEQFQDDENGTGQKMQKIWDTINRVANNVLTDAKKEADDAVKRFELDPNRLKEPLAEVLREYARTPLNDIPQQDPEKKLFTMIYAAITHTLQAQLKEVQIDLSDRPGEKFFVSSDNAKKIGKLMDNADNLAYQDVVYLPNVRRNGPTYRVTRQNVKQVFPSLALVTLKHPLLYPQGQ